MKKKRIETFQKKHTQLKGLNFNLMTDACDAARYLQVQYILWQRLSSVHSVSRIWVLQIFLSLQDMLFCAIFIDARWIEKSWL